jgi:hypothetical protein
MLKEIYRLMNLYNMDAGRNRSMDEFIQQKASRIEITKINETRYSSYGVCVFAIRIKLNVLDLIERCSNSSREMRK